MVIILIAVILAAAAVSSIIILRTVKIGRQRQASPWIPREHENLPAAEKLSRAIGFRTESFSSISDINLEVYQDFHRFLAEAFPLVHTHLERKQLSDFSVLYTWKGEEDGCDPVMFTAHWDVVPVREEEIPRWEEPPFSGAIKDGYIHGRGSLDDKISLISILEAAEALLKEGFRPRRTIYFGFGGDEEIGGLHGAAETAAFLEKQGVRLSWLLDEASVIIRGGLLGIRRPIALIGIAEKGHADFSITARGTPGHASMPPASTAAGILARAVCRIEKHPARLTLTPLIRRFLEALAPYTVLGLRTALSNLWLTGPLVLRLLAKAPASNSLARTTAAFTMLQGSPAENVLPDSARAIVNCRILPGDSVQNTLARLRKTAGSAVKVDLHRPEDSGEPVPPSPMEGEGFRLISESLAEVLPGVVPAPFLFNATTDSRHFSGVCGSTIRFMPVILDNEDLAMFHGINERVSVTNLGRYIDFLVHLMRKI